MVRNSSSRKIASTLSGFISITSLYSLLVILRDLSDASFGHLDHHMFVDKLQGIHIACIDNRLHSLLVCLYRERPQYIVCLKTVFFIDWDAKCLYNFVNTCKLWSYIIG